MLRNEQITLILQGYVGVSTLISAIITLDNRTTIVKNMCLFNLVIKETSCSVAVATSHGNS